MDKNTKALIRIYAFTMGICLAMYLLCVMC